MTHTAPAQPLDQFDDWLDRVTGRLPGPRSTVRAVRDELADGLHESHQDHLAGGLDPVAATRATLEEFGEPDVVAAELVPDLATARARRIGLVVLASGPVVGALWLWRLRSADLADFTSRPLEVLADVGGPMLAVLLVVAIVTVVAAVLTIIAGTGIPSRWLGARVEVALRAARAATTVTVAVDLVVLASLATMSPAAAPPSSTGILPGVALALAGAASAARVVACVTANRRCRATLHQLAIPSPG